MSRVLVVGNGPASHRFVERLRHHGHDGPVTVLGAEDRPAYHRGLLATVLAGALPPAAVTLPDPPAGVEVRTGVRATGLDRARRVVLDDRGREHPYDHLVLATGARTRDPGVAGVDLDRPLPAGVRTLRTLDGVSPPPDGDVVVVGGGRTGVQVALTMARSGADRRVELVHPGVHPMHRHLDERAGALLTGALSERGVTVHAGHRAVAHTPGTVVARGPSGEVTLAAPTVLLATGATPDTALASGAGLAVDRVDSGVAVDEHLSTADPRVHALGGAVTATGSAAAVGSPAAAWEQAEVLARRLAGDDTARYGGTRVLTHLRVGGVDVAAVRGPGEPDDTMTVSDPAGTRYARLDLRDGRLVAATVVGFPHAAGPLAQHWVRGTPLPTARLALLLGRPAAAGAPGPAEAPDDAVICTCNAVTKGTLVDAWRGGATDVGAVAARTRATTGCGTCASSVRRLLEALSEQDREEVAA